MEQQLINSKSVTELVDSHGRKVRKLRVSLLEDCNFRCTYCMPLNAQFPNKSNRISPDEILRLCELIVRYGVEEIRLTGGEPTIRQEFKEIVTKLSLLQLKVLALTTNASRLGKLLNFLSDTKCKHINISLDSLCEEKFKEITHSDDFGKVMNSIEEAYKLGFHVKLNVLVMRGINDNEICNFVKYSEQTGIEVRFMELMRIGYAIKNQKYNFISADEIIERVGQKFEISDRSAAYDSTSINFKTTTGALIGIIASESKPFCGTCSRWRLSANGKLRPCLMCDEGHRIAYKSEDDIVALFEDTLNMKPSGRIYEVPQNMNQIGG